MNIQCKVCLQTFVSTTASVKLKEHADNKHPKIPYEQCFPNNPL